MILASDLVLRGRLLSSYRSAGPTCPTAQEVLSTLEEKPETDFRDKSNAEPVFARLLGELNLVSRKCG